MIAMPIEFAEFEAKCRVYNYTKVVDQRTLKAAATIYAMWTRKNIKVEIKATKKENIYVAGFGLNKENLSVLKEELIQRGMTITKENSSHLCLKMEDDILGGFFTLVAVIEDIDGIAQRKAGARRLVEFKPEMVYIAAARIIQVAVECGMPVVLGRGNGTFDAVDSLITVGYSIKGRAQEATGKNAYREHIVPCTLIEREAIRMYNEGASAEEVAAMIKANLFILRISDEEANTLDNILSLRTVMPEGWKFGDDVYSRITVANIQLETKKVDN